MALLLSRLKNGMNLFNLKFILDEHIITCYAKFSWLGGDNFGEASIYLFRQIIIRGT